MLESLTKDIEKTDWNNKDSVVDFYERNKMYFKNINLIKDSDELIQALDIVISYLFALYDKKHFTKADICLEEISNSLIDIKSTDSFKRINERFLFISGLIFYKLERFNWAKTNFEELISIDPDNDIYKTWMEAIKDRLFTQKTRIFSYVGFGLFIFSFFSDLIIYFDMDFRFRLQLLSLVIMGFGFFGYKSRRLFIKKNNGL